MIDSFDILVEQQRHQEMVKQSLERQQLQQALGLTDRQGTAGRLALVGRLIAQVWPSTVRIQRRAHELPPQRRSEA